MFFIFVVLSMALNKHLVHGTNDFSFSSPSLALIVVALTDVSLHIIVDPIISTYSYLLMISFSFHRRPLLSIRSSLACPLSFL